MIVQKLNSIIGKSVTRNEIVALENSARKNDYLILAQNLRKLLSADLEDTHFVISEVSESNYIDQHTLCGFEFEKEFSADLSGKKSDNIYKEITNLIIDTIEKNKGKLIWENPWSAANIYHNLTNFVSKKRYSGINLLLLELIYPMKYKKEWVNPYFMTANQIEAKGGSLKPHPKEYPIVFYTIGYNYLDKDHGIDIHTYKKNEFIQAIKKVKHLISDFKNPKMTLDLFAKNHTFSIVQKYSVYNGEDIEGIDWKLNETPVNKDFKPIETAELIIENMPKKPLIKHSGNAAFFSPSKNYVNMPPKESFKKDQGYYSTLFHELIHSTGHSTRLNRSMKGNFGSPEYAFEELIAEIGAAYLTAEAGILNHHIKNTADYVLGWNSRLIKKLKDDKTFIFRAAAKAQKAANFILVPNKEGIPKYRRTRKQKPEKKTPVPVSKKKNKPSIRPAAEVKNKPAIRPKSKPVDPDQMALFGNKKKGLAGPVEKLPDIFQVPGQKAEKKNVFNLPGPIGKLLGELQKFRLAILLKGDTHAGKSEVFWQIINAMVSYGFRPAIFDLEQGGLDSEHTQAAIERNVSPENKKNLPVTGEAHGGIEAIRKYAEMFDVIAIDSFQKLGVPNTYLDTLRTEFPDTIFLVIFQQNGEGGTRGGVSADFDAPVVLKVHKVDLSFVNNYVEVLKNRGNAVGGKYNVFQKKIIIDKPAEEPKKK